MTPSVSDLASTDVAVTSTGARLSAEGVDAAVVELTRDANAGDVAELGPSCVAGATAIGFMSCGALQLTAAHRNSAVIGAGAFR